MTLFFDRCVGLKIPQALDLLGVPVATHDDHFRHDTTDEEWLKVVGKKGWYVVTCDTRLIRNASQRRALADHKIGCFVLSGVASRPRWYHLRIIARNWDRIEELAQTEPKPFMFRLYLRRPPVRIGHAPR